MSVIFAVFVSGSSCFIIGYILGSLNREVDKKILIKLLEKKEEEGGD